MAAIGARTKGADARQHGVTGGRNNQLRQRIQGIEPEFGHHRRQAFAAGPVAGGQGVEVALGHVGVAHVGSEETDQGLVHASGAHQVADGDAHAFFENLVGIGAETAAAHVGDVAGCGEKGDRTS